MTRDTPQHFVSITFGGWHLLARVFVGRRLAERLTTPPLPTLVSFDDEAEEVVCRFPRRRLRRTEVPEPGRAAALWGCYGRTSFPNRAVAAGRPRREMIPLRLGVTGKRLRLPQFYRRVPDAVLRRARHPVIEGAPYRGGRGLPQERIDVDLLLQHTELDGYFALAAEGGRMAMCFREHGVER